MRKDLKRLWPHAAVWFVLLIVFFTSFSDVSSTLHSMRISLYYCVVAAGVFAMSLIVHDAPLSTKPDGNRGILRGIFFFTPIPTGKMLKMEQYHLLLDRAEYFAVYAGAGRTDEARVIAQKIIKWDRFSRAPLVLRKVAELSLGDKAEEFLQTLNIPEINKAVAKARNEKHEK